MEIEEIKNEYINKYNGDINFFNSSVGEDLEKAKTVLNIQKKMYQFKNGVGAKDKNLVRNNFKKLDERQQTDISNLDKNSDDYRIHKNKEIKLENEISIFVAQKSYLKSVLIKLNFVRID